MPLFPDERAKLKRILDQTDALQDLHQIIENDEARWEALPRPAEIPRSPLDALRLHQWPDTYASTLIEEVVRRPHSTHSTGVAQALGSHPLRVRHHEQLAPFLGTSVAEIISHDVGLEDSPVMRQWNHGYLMSCLTMPNAQVTSARDVSALALGLFGTPLNHLLANSLSYVSGTVPQPAPRWKRPMPASDIGGADWVCVGGHDENDARAHVKWKALDALPDQHMADVFVAASAGKTTMTWHPLKKGFAISADNGKLTSTSIRVRPNASEATVQAWAACHHHQCRWALLFNTNSAIVMFLADKYELWVSGVIDRHDTGDDVTLTIALALAAIGLVKELPDGAVPADDFGYLDLSERKNDTTDEGSTTPVAHGQLSSRSSLETLRQPTTRLSDDAIVGNLDSVPTDRQESSGVVGGRRSTGVRLLSVWGSTMVV